MGRLSIEYLSSVIDAIPDLVRVIDRGHKIVLTNRAFKETFGDMAGKDCYSMWHTKCINCFAGQVMRTGKTMHGERRLGKKTYDMSAAPCFDEDGNITGIVEILKDVTSYVQLQEKMASFNSKMMKNLDMARRLQLSILRKDIPKVYGYSFHSGFFPCESIGGDMFDCFEMSDGRILMYVADVSGHGVMPAMLTVVIKQNVMAAAKARNISTKSILRILHASFVELNADDSIYYTMFLVLLNPQSGMFEYANAGHSVMPLFKSSGEVYELSLSGPPMCRWFEEPYYQSKIETMRSGDMLFLFTDGISGIHTKKTVKQRLMDTIKNKNMSGSELIDTIKNNFMGSLKDDLTILICNRH